MRSALPTKGFAGMSDIQGLLDAMGSRPGTFRADQYRLHDSKTGASYWVANGWPAYGMMSPSEYNFGFVDQFRFHSALKKWRAGYLHWINTQVTA